MFAYVRFEQDKSFYICKVDEIKNFKCSNKDDFDNKRIYKVMWEDGHFYNAQIVFLCGMKSFIIIYLNIILSSFSLSAKKKL